MHIPLQNAETAVAVLRAESKQPATLWLLCVADADAPKIPALLAAARAAGIEVCGGVFPGLIHGENRVDRGMIAIGLPGGSQASLGTLAPSEVRWGRPPASAPSAGTTASLFLFVDCLSPGVANLLEDLYDRFGPGVHLAGAGTGYQDLRAGPTVFAGAEFVAHAALLVSIPRRTTVAVRHGWKRVQGPFVASRTDGNVIEQIDWEPAGARYLSLVAGEAPSLAGRSVFPDMNALYPLCLAKEGGEDVVRDPIRVTESGGIATLSDVPENCVLYLAHGDPELLVRAAREAVEACGTPDDVETCFVSDCYSRTFALGDGFGRELAVAAAAMRRFTDATPEGVLALGELAAAGRHRFELYNKTFVVALIHR
ncbi:MAG: FIST N-terminal domain-containing protein [Burkholderiales bacterium]